MKNLLNNKWSSRRDDFHSPEAKRTRCFKWISYSQPIVRWFVRMCTCKSLMLLSLSKRQEASGMRSSTTVGKEPEREWLGTYTGVCVCVCERERERESGYRLAFSVKGESKQFLPWKCCFDNSQNDVTSAGRTNKYFNIVHHKVDKGILDKTK